MKHLFCSQAVLLFLAWSAAWSADPSPKPRPKTSFDFDPSKVQPAEPTKGKPVARIFDKYLYPNDVIGESRLQGALFGTLLDRYAEKEKINATTEEVRAYVRVLFERDITAWRIRSPASLSRERLRSMWEKESDKLLSEANETWLALQHVGVGVGVYQGLPPGQALLLMAIAHENLHTQIELFLGIQAVVHWKIDKSLYLKYGGTVIWQQATPFEPVGAYRGFLEEMEQQKVFVIYDEANRKEFWHYFVREHPFVVPDEKVKFDKPWWSYVTRGDK